MQNLTKPWTLPRHAWTMNVDAVEGSEEDSCARGRREGDFPGSAGQRVGSWKLVVDDACKVPTRQVLDGVSPAFLALLRLPCTVRC